MKQRIDPSYKLSESGDAWDVRATWVLVTYRRKPLFAESIRGGVARVLREVATEVGLDVERVDVRARCAIVRGRADPNVALASAARRLQRASAVRLRAEVEGLSSRRSVWTRRFLVTTGTLEPSHVTWFVGRQGTG